ncbi:hypothetical protein M8C21_005781 [Ambrosia artemisiifolia]|uniref:Uncharacterized protein n=1 Tax=Ambrosia artemisiifolia TaxID=4212 RepID=A0AAD5BRV3_AMBAR|nr:hypothetical protein M8C21_005781 [Ambrosia artemisiifolia]
MIIIMRRRLWIGVLIVMALGLSIVYLRLWTIDYQISSTETELLRRQFDLANKEAVDESAEWRLRFDEAEERATKCAKELKRVKENIGDNRMTQRLDMLQKENINLLERVETLKQELEAEKLKCSMQKL